MGNRVKELREKQGMSQKELAQKSGVNRITISMIETGKTKEMMSGTLLSLARALGVTLDQLFSA